jgi:hypothetical protein
VHNIQEYKEIKMVHGIERRKEGSKNDVHQLLVLLMLFVSPTNVFEFA